MLVMTAQETALGALEAVDLRDAWKDEARDFTPWLAKNLDRLASELGVELEQEQIEVPVGRYRADILARTRTDDSRVVIENQLEEANLQHLGQVLTYLAGLDAQIVVWIARGFDEAQLSAIRWLNEHTVDPYAFFAVRVRVMRIGDSPLAPVFDILERPSRWDRSVREAASRGGLSERGQFRRDFWAHVSKIYTGEVEHGYAGSNVYHHVSEADLRISQYVAVNEVGIYLCGTHGEPREDVLSRIAPYLEPLRIALEAEQINDQVGAATEAGTLWKIDTSDRANWDSMAKWLHDRRLIYERVLRETAV